MTTPSFEILRQHVDRYIDLSDAEFDEAAGRFGHEAVARSQLLLRAGDVCKKEYFVSSGCLRAYSVDANGREHIIQFAFEGWWISDLYSFLTGEPSTYYIEALEDADLLTLDRAGYERLCDDYPRFNRLFRLLLQNHHIATHRRIDASLSMSAEEKYLDLLEKQPQVIQRVALRHIASYLGITPESLSRVRAKLAARP